MAQPIHSSTLRRSSASAEKTTIAGTKNGRATTAGWTRESLSRSRDSNIGGEARRASARRSECVLRYSRPEILVSAYDGRRVRRNAPDADRPRSRGDVALHHRRRGREQRALRHRRPPRGRRAGAVRGVAAARRACGRRWPCRGGLAVAAVAAIVDGLLTISDRVGPATTVLTLLIVAGVAIAVLGRGVRA